MAQKKLFSAKAGKQISIFIENRPGSLAEVIDLLGANGFNMILWTDQVGNFGRHVGKTERFMTPGAFNPFGGGAAAAHQMGSVILALQNKQKWAQKLLHQLI